MLIITAIKTQRIKYGKSKYTYNRWTTEKGREQGTEKGTEQSTEQGTKQS